MATIKRADGTVISAPVKETPVEMEEIITNEEVKEIAPEIHLEDESDDLEVSPISGAEAEHVVKQTINIEAPWWRFFKLLTNLFDKDESVGFKTNEDTKGVFEIIIISADICKLAAIKKVVGTERTFGNVKVVISYVEEEGALTLEEFAMAFKDTGYLVDTKIAETPTGDHLYFPIMKKDVIQFYDDNIADYYGNLNATVADATIEIMDKKNLVPNFLVSTEASEVEINTQETDD